MVGDAGTNEKGYGRSEFCNSYLLIFYFSNVTYLVLNNVICSGLLGFYIINI